MIDAQCPRCLSQGPHLVLEDHDEYVTAVCEDETCQVTWDIYLDIIPVVPLESENTPSKEPRC